MEIYAQFSEKNIFIYFLRYTKRIHKLGTRSVKSILLMYTYLHNGTVTYKPSFLYFVKFEANFFSPHSDLTLLHSAEIDERWCH